MSSPPPASKDEAVVVPPPNDQNPVTESFNQDSHYNDITNAIDGHIYASVAGFHAKFFEAKPWSFATEQMVQPMMETLGEDILSHEGFAAWLPQLQFSLPRDAGTRYTRLWKEPGTPASSHSALVLSPPNDSGREVSWSKVMVIGGFCLDGSYRAGFLELCGHARAEFSYQPARLFLHGFYICEGKMELWVFDGSGIYSCEAFDIAQAPDRFLTALIGYMLMDDAELGASALIKEDNQGKYMLFGDDDKTGLQRFYLGEPAIFEQMNKNIVGDRLTCYRARLSVSERFEYAVKVKWSTAGENSEAKMLKLLKESDVWGVFSSS